MKLSSTQARSILDSVSFGMAIAVALLLRYLLAIPSEPFDIHSGWRAIVGWTVVVFALVSLFHAVIHFFRPISQPREPDSYTLAQAEIQAERAVKLSQHDEQQP